MFPKVTRKKPTCTTRHITVLVHPSNVPGERFTPFLPAGERSFPSARHSRASQSLLATPGQSCPHRTSPEPRSQRHRGAEGYQGRHRRNVLLSFQGVCTFKVRCPLAHVSRKDTSLPEGSDPHCRHDYNTHTHNSRAPGHPAACKTTRWGLNKTFPHCSKGIMYLRPEWHKTHPKGDILQGFMEAACVCESGQGVTSH